MRRRTVRGQAAAELALGSTVLVTVLLFGTFFAELGYVQIKVQLAAVAPLWDITHERTHDLWAGPGGWELWSTHAARAGEDASARFRDLDGLSSRPGAPTLTHAVTRTEGVLVECRNDATVPFQGAPQGMPGNPFPRGDSGVSCAAQATAMTFRIPRVFVDGGGAGGIFEIAHGEYTLPLCGAGRARQGRCTGRVGLLLDDWGFAGPQESQDCGLYDCRNTVFRKMVEDVYDANGRAQGSDASRLAAMVGGAVGGLGPIDENAFFFSAQMSEKEFTETLRTSHGDREWPTTPFTDGWKTAHETREEGWLGYVAPAQEW